MERTRADAAVTGVLLAGGRASRMGGRDKAFAAVGGEAIAVRSLRLFGELFSQVIVATNRPERYRTFGVETVADTFAGCGPLAGIHAAMQRAAHPHLFVAACDMPGLDPDVIRFLLGRIGDADAIVPRWDHDIEPLHAVYAVRLLPLVEEALRAGRHAIRDFLPRVRVDYVEEAELRRIRGTERSMLNVNTPEELAAIGGSLEDEPDPGDDLVDVVDDAGRTVRQVTRREMRARRLPHRSTYVLVFNRRGELFVHLRTPTKDVYPSHWDVCVGGVLAAGESFDDGAGRELVEELGVSAPLERLFPFRHADTVNIVHGMVYRTTHEGPFRLQRAEVVRGEFAPVDEIVRRATSEPFCPDGLRVLAQYQETFAAR